MPHWRTQGQFYWPSEHYSIPADNLCWHAAPSPYADHFCIREEGHPGKHKFQYSPLLRSYSHKSLPSPSRSEGPQPLPHRPAEKKVEHE